MQSQASGGDDGASNPANAYDRAYQRWYDKGAAIYDQRFEGDFAREQATLIVDLLHPAPGALVLDVGTGTGRAALPLAAAGAHVVGIDVSIGMLAHAARKRDAAGLSWPLLAVASGRRLPFPDATFDAVVSIRVLHLFPTPQLGALVDEMRRVLKPGGTLLVEFNSPLAAGGWIVARELLRRRRGQKDRHYLWPQQVDGLFPGLRDLEVHGFWFPGLGPLTRRLPATRPLLRLARLPRRLAWLGDKVLIVGMAEDAGGRPPAVADR